MKSGGLNSVPDSFAPAPAAEFPWQIRQPAKNSEGLRDTAEAIAPEAKALDRETNKALFVLLKTSKFLILMLVAPPYFFLFKFPRGVLKLAVPFIKTTQVILNKTLRQAYDKAKNVMESALNRISTHVVRQMESVSNLLQKVRSTISRSAKKQVASIQSQLSPLVKAAVWAANLSTKTYSKASRSIGSAMERLGRVQAGLKGLTFPKIVFSNPFKTFQNLSNTLRSGRSYAADALQAVWNQAKERVERLRTSLKKSVEDSRRRLSGLKDLSSRLADKVKNQANEISKAAGTIKDYVQNVLITQGEKLLVFVQQPYFALAPYALAMRGQASRAFRSVNQVFKGVLHTLHSRVSSTRVFLIQSVQAFLMPFKRGGKFLKKQAQKLASTMKKAVRSLAKQLQAQGEKLKEKAKSRIKQWLRHLSTVYSLLKKLMSQVLHALKLFWIWLKLMASFANFLIRELFREIKAWLANT